MGATEIRVYLSRLAVDKNVAASTQNKGFRALLRGKMMTCRSEHRCPFAKPLEALTYIDRQSYDKDEKRLFIAFC